MGYDGFTSYSHAADGHFAPALQRGLQRFARPWNARRALRIFRDETGLSTNPHLWSAIETALDESEWFVLLASAEAAESEWVNKEISHRLATKSVDHLLPVVTDGSWEWDATAGDFTAESTAVPDALRGALADEPRHLDLRWARDETDLDLRNSRFRGAVADLAASMHGMAKDDLYLTAIGHPIFTWGAGGSLGEGGDARRRYLVALHAADGDDYGPLVAFARA